MPRYRFNIIDGQKILDTNGHKLIDDDAARVDAERMARGLSKTPLGEHWKAVEVVDEKGEKIYEIPVQKSNDEQD